MAHVQDTYSGLWYPQDPTVDKINSQKMFIDNIHMIEAFVLAAKQGIHAPVKALADLRAINTSDTTLFKTGMLILVQELGMFMFNRLAIGGNGADGNAIIAPITGGGGWVPTTPSDIPLSGREASTVEQLDTILTDALTNMSSNSIKHVIVNCTQPFQPFGGGVIHMTIYKTNNSYAVIESRVYYSDPNIALQFTRSRYNGVWGQWYKLPYLDANGKIPVSQLPATYVSNATVVDESEVINLEVE